ncbi:LAETG motif-containing sortase-dependent surface protein [Streptomyces sp. 11x1]|uniref:LAETG motif-containing sortase-dependent surface protein n=1 Tax=Streptomyces sp. 11x1 TaxID=3038642 RepID=UPI0029302008|nr:LAETG motif-containing sortase-dependent surface protein [Streptomyces sp. 11x1]WNZ10881.1 LAETG motif-containing sortase-dependent surface protein [Streptomyces sp. 11x1]
MKLRRAMAVAAATAVIAPLALLSAPAAFATDTPGTTENSSTGTSGDTGDAAGTGDTTGTGGDSPDKDTDAASGDQDTSTDDQDAATDDETAASDDEASASDDQDTSTEDDTTSGEDDTTSTEDGDPSSEDDTKPSDDEGDDDDGTGPSDDEPWNPYEDCETFDLDDKLTASISGLPNQIVAGSGWHEFDFVIRNDSDKDLKKVWVQAFTEYGDDTNDDSSLLFDLAELQYKLDGKWTGDYQEGFEDEDGKIAFTGTFVAVLDSLEKNSTATLDLRVRVDEEAPAGSSFALSQAVYAGEESACYGNGDFYEFTVLAAGDEPGDDVEDAEPNGEKPDVTEGVKPQGGAKEITGNLAETGSSSALPMIGIAGGVAVAAGAGAMFVVRRKKAGAQA